MSDKPATQTPPPLPRAEAIEKIADLLGDFRTAMLTLHSRETGNLHARPMALQEERFDGTLYFITQKDTEKVGDLHADGHANVSFTSTEKNAYLSLTGTARTVDDREKLRALWNPFVEAWYPDGPDDPSLTLVAVDVEGAEYWDGPSSKIVMMARMAKAFVTGTTADDAGENRTMNL